MRDTTLAPLLVCMDDDFGVGLAPEFMSIRLQFLAKFDEVVYLAIKYYLETAIFIPNWLRAPFQINDAQAAVP